MTSEEYWHQDPWLFQGFYQADKIRKRQMNEEAWLNGLYVYNAFGSALATAFGKKKYQYTEKPLDIFPKTKAELESEKQAELEKITKNLRAMYEAQQRRKNGGT